MEIDEEYIEKVKSLIEQKDAENVKTLLTDLHPADIAELCNDLGLEEARFVYRLLDNETAADVLVEMDEDVRKEFLNSSFGNHCQAFRGLYGHGRCRRPDARTR